MYRVTHNVKSGKRIDDRGKKKIPREREKIRCYLKNGYFVTVNQPVRDDDRKSL